MNDHFTNKWATYTTILIIVAFFMDKLSFFEAMLLVMLTLLVEREGK